DARRHVERLGNSRLPPELLQEGILQVIEPLRSRIKPLCQRAERDAEADPANGDNFAEQLLDEAAGPLAALDLLLPEDHAARQAEHDQVALAALQCIITFGNRTRNHRRSLALIDRLAPLAAGAAAQNRIAEDRTVIAENIEVGLCWFCGVNERIDGCAREVAMHGDVGRSDGRVTWRHLKLTVPRCRSCKEQ